MTKNINLNSKVRWAGAKLSLFLSHCAVFTCLRHYCSRRHADVILMLTPDYAELQLDIDSFRLQNNPVTSENDEISASRFKYSNIISNVKMQQGNSSTPPVNITALNTFLS